MPNLKSWLDKGEIQRVRVGVRDLENLLALVERDLNDAQVEAVSADRRFASAYGAALNLANYVIRKEGYRVVGQRGHHRTTFLVTAQILGKASGLYVEYFDLCRRKRNKVDYDFVDVVSETEVKELIERVIEFGEFVMGDQ
jgi:hypothetical protein